MPRCILCLREWDRLTEEHVFPAVLGGTLTVKAATCSECNNGFSPLEQRFAARLSHFRRIFGIPNRSGDLPVVEITMNIEGRYTKGTLQPDGTFRMIPTVSKDEAGKTIEVVHEHLTEARAVELQSKVKPGWELVEEKNPAREAEISMAGDLDFLASESSLLVAAKIAFAALAFKVGKPFAMGDAFQEVRRFILTGQGTGLTRLFCNERFLAQSPQGPHQHSVVIVGRKDRRAVSAIVRLFGGLCYFVNLSTEYEGADFASTLVLDAYRGEENMLLVSHLDTEFRQIEDIRSSEDTVWDHEEICGQSFLKTIDEAIIAIANNHAKPAVDDEKS